MVTGPKPEPKPELQGANMALRSCDATEGSAFEEPRSLGEYSVDIDVQGVLVFSPTCLQFLGGICHVMKVARLGATVPRVWPGAGNQSVRMDKDC